MSKNYTVRLSNGESHTRARKDAAIKIGEESGMAYVVLSPSGAVVAEKAVPMTPEEEEKQWSQDEAASDLNEQLPPKEEPKEKKPVNIEKMKAKIAMLLKKAESSTFEAERDTFNSAAEKLMLRLGISIAELEASGDAKPEKIVQVQRIFPGNYSISMIPFTLMLARGFGNITILQQSTRGLSRIAHIIGHESDVEQFTTLLDSLSLQVMSALHIWQKENREERRYLTDMQKYVQHRSFIEGFGRKVGERLEERRGVEEETASTGAALVLASKQSKVDDWIGSNLDVGKGRGGSKSFSSIGFMAGQQHGEKANLNDPGIRGKAGEIGA